MVPGFALLLAGIKNQTYAIDWSSGMEVWTALGTNQLSSSAIEFQDPAASNGQRFYRARLVVNAPRQ